MDKKSTNQYFEVNRGFIILAAIFVAGLVIASVLAAKIIHVAGLYVPAGILAYSLTFIATDVISEIWGKRLASVVVFGGFIALLVVSVLIQLALLWPPAPFWENQAAFGSILGSTFRVISRMPAPNSKEKRVMNFWVTRV